MYLIRLDDASEYMNVKKWSKIENILDKYDIKPLVGVIPNNQDNDLVDKYEKDLVFWQKVKTWQLKEWEIALHGYTHVCCTADAGINPVNKRSEFAGLALEVQRQKIREGINVFKSKGINPKVFFAPSHTFDMNTLDALKRESNIRIISDTVANDIYKKDQFYFIPQQSGHVRTLPFRVITFCYHPNTMSEQDFNILEEFIKKNNCRFSNFNDISLIERKQNVYDKFLKLIYFSSRRLKQIVFKK